MGGVRELLEDTLKDSEGADPCLRRNLVCGSIRLLDAFFISLRKSELSDNEVFREVVEKVGVGVSEVMPMLTEEGRQLLVGQVQEIPLLHAAYFDFVKAYAEIALRVGGSDYATYPRTTR